MKSLKRIEKVVFYLLLFLLPSQLALHFWPSWAFVFGIRVDFLSPSIYTTDILVVILFVLTLILDGRQFLSLLNKYWVYILLFLALVIINIVYSISPFESIYKWIKVVEFSFVIYYFSKQQVLKLSGIVNTLLFSSAVFSLIGILQFIKGGTLGGFLYYLGERTFTLNAPGIALVTINGIEHLRVYSTFSHPNSLAGFLGVIIILVLTSGGVKNKALNIMAFTTTLVCFALSFSVSAYIAILFTVIFYLISRKQKLFKIFICCFLLMSVTLSLTMPLIASAVLDSFTPFPQNISQRLDLAVSSGKLISQRLFIGEGLGTFIIAAPQKLQPVHNIFLLVFAEIGLIGLILFSLFIYKVFLRNPLIFIFVITTGLTDHYWLTLQQNLLLLSVVCGLSFTQTWCRGKMTS